MEELKTLLSQVDDDYLIGLSNKGIVKRAYKDLEQETPTLSIEGSKAKVTLKEVTCMIGKPLGESSCSCPSKSICRHIVTAIVWLKQTQQTIGEKEETKESKVVLEEALQLPVEKLKRICGTSKYRQFVARLRVKEEIEIKESTTVTIVFPWEMTTVKLLEPLEFSTCTCHSKELCVHKAQAILFYQLQKEKITIEQLEALIEDEKTWDESLVKEASNQICNSICQQILIGLSRQSQEVSGEMERLAVIAHRASLPRLERLLRECSARYEQYFARKAQFKSEDLVKKVLQTYRIANELTKVTTQKEIEKFAGAFRDSYELVGTLELMGVASRAFHAKSGYEGENYYFLEINQKKWYTWTDARPVFYEGTRTRPVSSLERMEAPWTLGCSREKMLELVFRLNHAKVTEDGKLSTSQETKSTIVGTREAQMELLEQMTIWDYEVLVEQNLEQPTESLVLIGAVRWEEPFFDKINQKFQWKLFDSNGKHLIISLRYTKEEQLIIRVLENLEKRLQKQGESCILFFGSLYLDEKGQLCLYPIEFFKTMAKPVEQSSSLENETILPKKEVVQVFEQYAKEAFSQVNDLFVSGLYSVLDTTIDSLRTLSEEGEQLGLHTAGKEFQKIKKLLQEKRHNMEFTPKQVVERMAYLEQYLSICQKKISIDNIRLYIREEN